GRGGRRRWKRNAVRRDSGFALHLGRRGPTPASMRIRRDTPLFGDAGSMFDGRMTDISNAPLTSVLPLPTGHHPVGRSSVDWTDHARSEKYSDDPQERRRLVVWFWYPAEPGSAAERAPYLPEAWAPVGQLLGLDVSGVHANAVADAPLSK